MSNLRADLVYFLKRAVCNTVLRMVGFGWRV